MIRKFNVNVTQSKRFEVVMMGSRGGHRSRTSSALFTRFVYVWILIIFFFFIFENWKKLACDWHKYWNDDKFKYSECQTARKFDSLVSFRLMNVSKCGLQCLQQSSFSKKWFIIKFLLLTRFMTTETRFRCVQWFSFRTTFKHSNLFLKNHSIRSLKCGAKIWMTKITILLLDMNL